MNKKRKSVPKQKAPVKKRHPDRRIQRTRQLLRDALTALVLEKGYDATTVQDILDRANLGRSTFYAHFHDKDELLVDGFEQLKQMFEEYDAKLPPSSQDRKAQKYNPTLTFFRHASEQHRLYKAIVGKSSGDIVQSYLYKYISTLASRHMKHLIAGDKKTPVPQELIVHYLVSSFLAILTWWLNHDMPYTAEEIHEMYHRLTLPGINAGLGKA